MKSARKLFQKLLVTGSLTLAPAIALAPARAEAAEAAPTRGGVRQAAEGSVRAAFAHHPDDADGAAALRHAAPADSVGRLVGGRAPCDSGAPDPGSVGRRRPPPPAAGGSTVGQTGARARRLLLRLGVDGRVSAKAGTLKDAYVYVDMVKGAPARGHSLEIRQKDKQFSPQVAVVQRGTTVVFPNMDAIFHNVFSPSGKNSFDLGSYRSGDTPRSVVLTTPGVVEVFCNIHARMNATVLVVPNALYAKVGPDGTFRLENVPSGARKLVAWSPGAKAVQEKVEVGSGSPAQVAFTLEYEGSKAHTNKLGQPYGSYKE